MQRSLEAYLIGRDAGRLQLSAAFEAWKRGRFAALTELASQTKPTVEILDDLRPARGVIAAVALGGLLWLAIVAAAYGLVLV